MKKNDEIRVLCEGLSDKGLGVGRAEGMVLFIKGAIPGDEVIAGITAVKKSFSYARVVEIIKSSPDRIEPPCPVFGKCGGCQIMQLSYEAQLNYKDDKVAEDLRRIGGLSKDEIQRARKPIVSSEPFSYRNKSQYPVGLSAHGETAMGFYAINSHRIVENPGCLIGQPRDGDILKAIKGWMDEYYITPYDEIGGRGLIRHVLIRHSMASGDVMVTLVINAPVQPLLKERSFFEGLTGRLSAFSGISSICLNENRRRDNVILGKKTLTLMGEGYLTDSIQVPSREGSHHLEFRISAGSFYQVNTAQMEKLYGKVLEYAALSGDEMVWDVYCGIGTISLALAKEAGHVVGIEEVPQAIENARDNALLNNISNAEFICARAEEILSGSYDSAKLVRPDVVVIDPPRKGCKPEVLKTLAECAPDRIVYVSCNPATLARDLKYLCSEGGYTLMEYTPVDQFCHSVHVESVVLITRKEK